MRGYSKRIIDLDGEKDLITQINVRDRQISRDVEGARNLDVIHDAYERAAAISGSIGSKLRDVFRLSA